MEAGAEVSYNNDATRDLFVVVGDVYLRVLRAGDQLGLPRGGQVHQLHAGGERGGDSRGHQRARAR